MNKILQFEREQEMYKTTLQICKECLSVKSVRCAL